MATYTADTKRPLADVSKGEDPQGRRSSSRPYPTRGSSSAHDEAYLDMESAGSRRGSRHSASANGTDRPQKHVTFQHILPDPRQCARLPMRVMISPHDTTDSIIATVKNFYGLYGPGVSFQDRDGTVLIAAYDNFQNDMTVYVKETISDPAAEQDAALYQPKIEPTREENEKPRLGAPFEMRPPTNRLTLQTDGADYRPRSRLQEAAPCEGELHDGSDSDGDAVSVTSSRRSKAEAHVSAEISVDNIVEGGRRKRAKFESFVSLRPFTSDMSILMIARNSLSLCHHRFLPALYPPSHPKDVRPASMASHRRRNTQITGPSSMVNPCLHRSTLVVPTRSACPVPCLLDKRGISNCNSSISNHNTFNITSRTSITNSSHVVDHLLPTERQDSPLAAFCLPQNPQSAA